MSVWDNQQETSWFVGILEAEGSCIRHHCIDGGQVISISNTDIDILNSCTNFLDKRCISYGLYEMNHKNRENRKDCYQISINGKNNCWTLIKMLISTFQCRYQEFINKLEFGSSTTTREISLVPDLHWLIGVFEGEGYFSIEHNSSELYTPIVGFVNTNLNIVQKFVLTLKSIGCSWTIQEYQNDLGHKKTYKIRMRSINTCKWFLNKTKDLWRSNKYSTRVSKLLEFVTSRSLLKKCSPYTNTEIQIYRDLKIMI